MNLAFVVKLWLDRTQKKKRMSNLDNERDLDLDRDDKDRERGLAGDRREAFFGDLLHNTQSKEIRTRHYMPIEI